MTGLCFGVLGTIEAWRPDGSRVEVGHSLQRRVLAALLADVGRVVPADTLVDRVWGDSEPRSGRQALYSYISRLRGTLRDLQVSLIRETGGGYRLTASPDTVDVYRFRATLERARAASQPEQAEELLEETLGLWRGSAFAEADTPWFNTQREALHGERLAAELDLAEARLELGRHTELLTELSARVEEHPLDERAIGQQMLALYRSGRQAEALEQYARTRRRLADELGVDPGTALQQLYERILAADSRLSASAATRRKRGPAAVAGAPGGTATHLTVPRQLPSDMVSFVGREAELSALEDSALAALCGPGGIGKTALAVRWAHRMRSAYPDGQLFVDLHGCARRPLPVGEALARFLRALGVAAEQVPRELEERIALYRSTVADRRLLVVLDNAADAEHVRPLLPGTPSCRTVVTSRTALHGLAASHDARIVPVGLLTGEQSHRLLSGLLGSARERSGESRPDAEPAGDDRHEAVAEVAELCHHLPLALRLAAAHLAARPYTSLAEYCARLRSDRLTALEVPGDPAGTIRSTFTLSYQELEEPSRRMFRLLGLHPGPDIDGPTAAALSGLAEDRAEELLTRLAATHLISRNRHGRWQMHDLLHDFAAEREAGEHTERERRDAVRRLMDWLLHGAARSMNLVDANRHQIPLEQPVPGLALPEPAGYDEALDWLETKRPGLPAVVRLATESGLTGHAWRLACTVWRFLYLRGYLDDWISVNETVLSAAADTLEEHGRAETLTSLATAYHLAGRYEESLDHYTRALPLHQAAGNRQGEVSTLANLGATHMGYGQFGKAIVLLQRALPLQRELCNSRGQANVLGNLAACRMRLGDYRQALADFEQALRLFRQVGDRRGEAHTLENLGQVRLRLGETAEAETSLRGALALHREIDYPRGEAEALTGLGNVLRARGRYVQALEHHQRALDITEAIREPGLRCDVLNELARTSRESGNTEQALHCSQTAVALARSSANPYGQARAAAEAHLALKALQREAEAATHLAEARRLMAELGIPPEECGLSRTACAPPCRGPAHTEDIQDGASRS